MTATPSTSGDLITRLLTAIIALPPIFAAIWLGNPWFPILVALTALVGAMEFYDLASKAGPRPLRLLGTFWSLLLIANAWQDGRFTLPLLGAIVLFSLVGLLLRFPRTGTLLGWGWTLLGIFYVGWLLSLLILLRNAPQGREWVMLAILATFSVDTAAYLVGRGWGRHPLAPRISPGKTWEGAIGGLAAGIFGTFGLSLILGLPLSIQDSMILGGLVSIVAQGGDLFESALKRRAGVKDAGWLVPGHGGVLDRLDSIVFSAAVVYYYTTWLLK